MTTENLPSPQARSADSIFDLQWITEEPGAPLFLRSAKLADPAKAEVLVTHGLGEHSARYGHVAEAFARAGIRLWIYDLHGHGRSAGRRGDTPGYAVFLDDLERAVSVVKESRAPIFLMGHSLGGQIVLNYLATAEDDFAGAVICSPWLRLAFEPPAWRLALARLSLRIAPGFTQTTQLTWEQLSRDREHLESIPEREWTHRRISSRLYFEIARGADDAAQIGRQISLPLLLIHGEADRVTSTEATKEFFRKAAAADKTLKIYPGARHETLNELCRAQVIADIVAWLLARVDPVEGAGGKSPVQESL